MWGKTMKLTFFSNFLNHHQIPCAMEFYKHLGHDYRFVSTVPMDDERLGMGWKVEQDYPFELKAYESEKSQKLAHQLAMESDVVILGSAPDAYIIPRLRQNKLTFKYSERPYKKGIHLNNLIRVIGGTWLHHGRFQRKPLYMLAASSYTATDFAKLGCYRNKCYRWGYFPETISYDVEELMEKKGKGPIRILWTARMIDWKHPEHALLVAKQLKERDYSFHMDLVGDGPLRPEMESLCHQWGLEDCVTFYGSVPAKDVRCFMEQASIFLFTSDQNEGWGAVLNESMNSGCAVVANDEIGSVAFLLDDGVNGCVYHKGNVDELCHCVEQLLTDAHLREQLGRNAYHKITEEWSAQMATTRFLELAQSMLNCGEDKLYSSGPCSKIFT